MIDMDEKLRILLCEDDENLGMLLREYLQAKGYSAELYPDGEAGFKAFLKNKYDLCVFDVMMPKKDGFTLAQEVRAANAEIPIIFLTAKTLKEDILEGFKIGADDYITKPFSVRLVLMRVEAVLRRAKDRNNQEITTNLVYENIRLNRESHSVFVGGNPISLTHTEYGILELFMLHPDRVFTRDNLLNEVWGYDFAGEEKTVNIHIMNLRRKLDTDLIETIRGVGYRLGKEN